MMADDFFQRIDELAARVGHGRLEGSVEVNQVYAHFQHEGLDLKHPHGGQAKYLEEPLYANVNKYMENLAEAVLNGDLDQAMIDNVEDLSGEVEKKAPVDLGNLRESGHPVVTSAGVTVYDRAPVQRRLTEEELKALHPGGHKYGH
jgi:hypothetical protein